MEGGTSVANAMQPSPDSSMEAGASQPTMAPVHAGQGGGVDSRVAWGTAAPNASLDWSTPLHGPQGAQPTGQILQSTVASPQTGYGGVARLDDPVRQARYRTAPGRHGNPTGFVAVSGPDAAWELQ